MGATDHGIVQSTYLPVGPHITQTQTSLLLCTNTECFTVSLPILLKKNGGTQALKVVFKSQFSDQNTILNGAMTQLVDGTQSPQ